MKKKYLVPLIFIFSITLAIFFRLNQLSEVPSHPFLDEVSNGYNAYSILHTGRDEYTRPWPILLQAYDDFRPAQFVYFTIPFVFLFNLTVFAVRIPSVLLATISLVLFYFLVKELFSSSNNNSSNAFFKTQDRAYLGLCALFLLSISPWHIYNSRLSNEINLALTFLLAGTYCFLRFVNREKSKYAGYLLFTSMLCFTGVFYAYHGIKLFVPFFVIFLVVLYWRKILARKKAFLLSLLACLLLLTPLIRELADPRQSVRLGAVSIFSLPQYTDKSALRSLYDKNEKQQLGVFFDNRRLAYKHPIVENYFSNLDFSFLFGGQKVISFSDSDFSPFYIFEFPLLLLGIYFLARNKYFTTRAGVVIIIWILLSPIPSAISTESPHANRTYQLLPPLIIIQAAGLFFLTRKIFLQKRIYSTAALSICAGVIGLSVLSFYHSYFATFTRESAPKFQYGLSSAFAYAKEREKNYKVIFVSNQKVFSESYMYFLFFNRYDPAFYQKNSPTTTGWFLAEHIIDKYHFVNLSDYYPQPNTLYLLNPHEIPPERLNILQEIKFPDNQDALWIAEKKQDQSEK